VLKWRPK